MPKTSKIKRSEPITINTIYETIKDRNLVQELWKEIVSDIGNKPTYKRIKAMVSCIINHTLSDFDTEPADNSERLQRRGIFTEVSIMAYTVDRVISEFLYRRLQSEFKSMVGNMLEELQTEKIPKREPSPSKINSMFENIESIFTKKVPSDFDKDSLNTQQMVEAKVEANKKPVRKRGRPKKSVAPSTSLSSESSSSKVADSSENSSKRGRPKKSVAPSTASESSSSKVADTSDKSSQDENFKAKDSDLDSNLTYDSFSSVHTNDLSSCDDNVSIYTDNGKRKKIIPLKKANIMIQEGRLPNVYKVDRDVQNKMMKREAAARKVLPQRKRKPNSRYNAETMYCQVKDYSSPRGSPSSSETSEDSSSEASEEASSKPDITREAKRAKIFHTKTENSSPTKPVTTRSLRNGTPTKDGSSQNIPTPTSSSTPLKNSAQRYTSSDLYKPRFHFGSNCIN